MSLEYVLDGYNIIHSSERFSASDLKGSRDALLRFLQEQRPQGSLRNQVIVVFDGKPGYWHDGEPLTASIKTVFTQNSSADQWIKQYVDSCPNPRKVVVVSNDREIVLYARKLMTDVLSVKDFLLKANMRRKSKAKVKRKASGDEIKSISYREESGITKEMADIWLKKESPK